MILHFVHAVVRWSAFGCLNVNTRVFPALLGGTAQVYLVTHFSILYFHTFVTDPIFWDLRLSFFVLDDFLNPSGLIAVDSDHLCAGGGDWLLIEESEQLEAFPSQPISEGLKEVEVAPSWLLFPLRLRARNSGLSGLVIPARWYYIPPVNTLIVMRCPIFNVGCLLSSTYATVLYKLVSAAGCCVVVKGALVLIGYIVKNADHNPNYHLEMTFCPANCPKPKESSLNVVIDQKKQILTCNLLTH